MPPRTPHTPLTEAEWKIMHCVWQADEVCARDVLEAVGDETGWAYTTVKTMLARLAEKGALTVRMRSNTSHYRAVLTRKDARKSALSAVAERAFDGTPAQLVQFMLKEERLSKKELRELKRMLDEDAR